MGREGTEFDVRLQEALALLDGKGLRKSTYAQPLFRLLWKMGVKVPPPHMAGFAFNSLLMGGFFGVFWGLTMWLLLWERQGMPLAIAAIAALLAGALFGLAMAWYLRYGARNARFGIGRISSANEKTPHRGAFS